MKQLARHRDFRLLFAGHVTSLFGDRALFVVLGIWALELTGSTGAGGIAFGFLAVAGFLAPVAGVIADRFPRRHVLIGNDLATAVIVLALLFVNDSGDVWIIYAVALIYGFSQQVGAAARSGLVAGMLPDELLAQANGVLESARSGIRIAAPVAGAGLYVLSGGGLVAIVDAATFVLSAAALSLVRAPDIARAKRGRVRTSELLAGFRHFFTTPVLRAILPAVVFGAGGVGLAEVIPFAVVHDGLHRRGAFLGVLGAFHGAGAIAGGLGAGKFIGRVGEVRSLALALALGAGGMASYAFSTVASALLASLLFGCCLAGRDRQLDDADPAEHADGAARTRRGRGRGARLDALRRRHRARLRARDDGRLPRAHDRRRRRIRALEHLPRARARAARERRAEAHAAAVAPP